MEAISVEPFAKEETRSLEWVRGYKKGFHDGKEFARAAAPDLLAALEQMLQWAEANGLAICRPTSNCVMTTARAAIAKAKGGAA